MAEQYLPDEEALGTGFIAWLKSRFRWMFESAQASASIGTAYVYADALPSWALLGEYDNGNASGTGRTEYIWQPSRDGSVIPVAMRRNGEFFTIHTDHLGTPRMVRDSTNKTVWQLPYSAFGNNRPVGVLSTTTTTGYAITPGAAPLKSTRPAQALNLRFPGQYADSETGEFYNYFRQYDPKTGRYTQADPIGLDGGWNRYSYVSGNAVQFVDSNGLEKLNLINPFRDPVIWAAAEAHPNPSNALLIISHGNPQAVKTMSAGQLADYIKANSGWQPGHPIILNACRTGQGNDSVAEQLSKALGGNTVVAPDQYTWNIGLWDIGTYAAKSEDRSSPDSNRPDFSKPGTWRCFGKCEIKK